MDKQQAINIVRETFESSFKKERFAAFINNLLNEPDFDQGFGSRSGKYIPDSFKEYIDKYERLGVYEDGEEKRIDLLIVHLKKETSIERARSMQRNFIAGYLQGKYGSSSEKDAALVAFVAPNGEDWRFSLVRLEVRLDADEKGKLKVKDEFTPAKRWSFLVGSHEKSHTAQTQFVPIMQDTENNPTLAELEEAFSIEKVTNEFFKEYRRLFIWTKDELDTTVRKNAKTKADFESKGIDTVNLAKKLLGQIIFLYYLQKKGWFGVPTDAAWGQGSKNFLRELFEKKHGDYKNFFNDILEPLFYEALRIDRSHDDHYYRLFDCKIPFLNGGLFDPMGNYDWVKTEILLANDLFSNKKRINEVDTGDGILDIFDRYNFTVREDEPFEKEVAIDPELLGKAYEKFNAIRPDNYKEYIAALDSGKKGDESKFNKQYGVYYTPREIVHYMCQQSLINYLYSELNPDHVVASDSEATPLFAGIASGDPSTSLRSAQDERPRNDMPTKDAIALLIQHGESLQEHEAQAAEKETRTYSPIIAESIRKNASLIDEKLAAIKVCDPAVGSGAFPVGMMSEIVKAREALKTWAKSKKTTYDFKRECIENSLYGVDIDSGAVEIAKLRLWLSLVVDEDDPQNIKPLPNLDYKIIQGNSLLGLPDGIFLDTEIQAKLEKNKKEYFYLTDPNRKRELRKEINYLFDKLVESAKQFAPLLGDINFDFHTHFSEVFQKQNGFDVVIANPPYLKERDNKTVFRVVTNSDFGKKHHQGKMDYWYYFLHKAIEIARGNASISFITSRYWLNSSGAKKIINHVSKELSFVVFVDIGKLKVFEEVEGQHMVAVYKKTKQYDEFIYKKLENEVSDIARETNGENITITKLSNKLIFSNNEILLDKDISQSDNTVPLGEIADISQGVVEATDKVSRKQLSKSKKKDINIGDGVFVLNHQEYTSLNLTESERKAIRKYLDPNDVFRYGYKWTKEYLIYSDKMTKELIKKRAEYSHLKGHLDKMKEFITSSNRPYGIHRPRDIKYFTNPKILFKGMFVENEFAYDDADYFVGFSFSTIIQKNRKYDLKFILAVLNSKYALNWFWKNGKKRGAGVDIGVEKLRQFPIKVSEKHEQNNIIKLVDRVLAAKRANPQADTSKLEGEIDQLVYELYGLTEEEIEIVEGKG